MAKILPEEFKTFSTYIQAISGIYLDQTKAYLVETRLAGLLQELGCSTFSELYFKAKADLTKKIQGKIIDAMTTGETLFFRDASPFELLQHKIIPDLLDRRNSNGGKSAPINIRIWSAACSTGQEVYSIGMVLKDLLVDLSKYNIKLLGTDLSDAAVARASYGFFNSFEIGRGMPADRLQKYFLREKDGWKIKDEIRGMASFSKVNLMENLVGLGKFDVIFCRNVAIYFTEEERKNLFNKMGGALEQNGYLIIGSTESLTGIAPQFEPKRYLRSVYYQRKGL
jgi:chemotaxis protein methyltransferase CheR